MLNKLRKSFKKKSTWDFKTIHVEITDKCNASCPMCGRNILGGKVNPHLPLVELNLNDVKAILPPDLIEELDYIYFCGNYGDPIMASELLEVVKYLRESNKKLKISLNTNASARTPQWWRNLAMTINGKGDVKFAIDGLADTHAIYRRGTDFNKIIENAMAFIDAGGKAIWEFIVFKHNEHQIQEAKEMSEKLGFAQFRLKKTGRFFSSANLSNKEKQEVRSKNGEIEYFLEKPASFKFQNSSLLRARDLKTRYGSMQSYIDRVEVDCKTKREKSIYLSAEGLVFPCCWTANQLYLWYMPKLSSEVAKLLEKQGGVETINAKNRSIKAIVKSPFFDAVQSSWGCSSVENGKLKVCAKTCGKEFDQFKDQYH